MYNISCTMHLVICRKKIKPAKWLILHFIDAFQNLKSVRYYLFTVTTTCYLKQFCCVTLKLMPFWWTFQKNYSILHTDHLFSGQAIGFPVLTKQNTFRCPFLQKGKHARSKLSHFNAQLFLFYRNLNIFQSP